MSRTRSLAGILALIGILTVAASASASAEMFTCHDRPGQLLYSYNGTPDQYIRHLRGTRAPRYYSHRTSRYYRAGSSRYRRQATYYSDTRYWNGR